MLTSRIRFDPTTKYSVEFLVVKARFKVKEKSEFTLSLKKHVL